MPQLVSGLYGLAHRVVDRGRQALSTEAVDGDLEHSNAGRLLLERGRKTVGLDPAVRDGVARTQRADVCSRRRRVDAFERASILRSSLFERGEDAAPIVRCHHDRQVRPRFVRPDQQSVAAVEECQVADVCDRPARRSGQRCADRSRQSAVDPSKATVADDQPTLSRSRIGLDEPTNSSPSGGTA